MPPKQAPSKKTTEKVKAKIVEDKTFGLKNKKGAKQQKFIQQVTKQVSNKGLQNKPLLDTNEEREKKKLEEQKKKEELIQLFKPVLQTVAKGVDPKSVVCVYFKTSSCQKGDKCKFSHDLSIERKAEKRNIYEDVRGGDKDGMEDWDDQKLEDVINQKHGEDNSKKQNTTQIVCKYFIEAVENKTYGWFWSCPNGDTCMYRHALPPGFTLKSDMKKKGEEEEVSLELLIEKERASLGANVTKVTLESFLKWKLRKLTEKKDEKKRQEDKKKNDFKLGFHSGLTGRDMFTFNPDLIANEDDDDTGNDVDYRHRVDDELEEGAVVIRDINADFFAQQAVEADGTGTLATNDRFAYLEGMLRAEQDRQKSQQDKDAAAAGITKKEEAAGGDDDEEEEGDEENEDEEDESAETQIKSDSVQSKPKAATKSNGPSKLEIDESLFNLEDLAEIEDELENLDIE